LRILIIKLSSLGDLFHALPAVHNLKQETGATMDWVTNSAYADLVRCFDDVTTVIPFPRTSLRRDGCQFLAALRQQHYDMVIDLQGLLKSALVARAARTNRRIGPSFHREGSRLFYHAVAGPRNKERHAVIENMDIIQHLGLPRHEPVFPITLPETMIKPPSPHLVICPASRWETKNWPAERFAAVAKHLKTHGHASITLLGAPSDKPACQRIADELGGDCLNLAGKTSIVDMGSILKKADLLLANDSGPVHMAAAVGTPALVIFGPTLPHRTGPFGTIHRVVQDTRGCPPCMSRHCRLPETPCILNVSPGDVIDVAMNMLQDSRTKPQP